MITKIFKNKKLYFFQYDNDQDKNIGFAENLRSIHICYPFMRDMTYEQAIEKGCQGRVFKELPALEVAYGKFEDITSVFISENI